jgi:chromosome segregation ATPase
MSVIRKLIGVLLMIAAIIGLFISVAGIGFFWRIEDPLTQNIQSTIDLLSQTMTTTAQGLTITQSALEGSVATISSLQSTVQTTANTIKSSSPMVEEISTLMQEDLPRTIQATEASLRSAAQSAQVIDGLLGTLSGIPLLGPSLNYNPEVPLSTALEEVAENLSSLPGSFANMKDSLEESTSNLETFQADLTVMAESIGEIQKSVAQYDQVIQGYQQSIEQVITGLDNLKENIPTYVHYLVLGLTLFFVWMAIAQLGLLTQGWELLTEKPQKKEEKEEKEEVEPPPAATEKED